MDISQIKLVVIYPNLSIIIIIIINILFYFGVKLQNTNKTKPNYINNFHIA